MSKKSKPARRKKTTGSQVQQTDKWMALAGQQMLSGDYAAAVETCQRLLNFLPQKSLQRAEVLDYLGSSQSMLQNFPESYEAYSEALSINPRDAQFWYNRGLAARFNMRIGQSLHDIERAVELNTNPTLTKQFASALKDSQKFARMALKMRGPDFTIDQLIEQEGYYQDGLKRMIVGDWEEAVQAFQRSIAMRDCMPQPWGNIGTCLIMQERYDEAEAALKRALEIDPRYRIAKQNLALLPETRRTGPPKMLGLSDPMKSAKINHDIIFVKE